MAAPRPFRLGLTGDVGAGKSTVRRWLEAAGAAAIDADAVVHALLADDPAVRAAVAERFGPAVAPGGGIDRAALAAVVFGDPAALAALEAILHPRVAAVIDAWWGGVEADVAVVEAVKLVEAGLAERCDGVWLVVAAAPARAARLTVRGWGPAEIARRMAAAPPLAPRLAAATEVIDNTGPPDATAAQLEAAWARLRVARRSAPSGRAR